MYKREIDRIEDAKIENKEIFKKVEDKVDDIHHHIQESNNIISLVAEGFQGEQALKFYDEKEEMLQMAYQKNLQYYEDKKDEYHKKSKQLELEEEEYFDNQQKLEDEDGDYF